MLLKSVAIALLSCIYATIGLVYLLEAVYLPDARMGLRLSGSTCLGLGTLATLLPLSVDLVRFFIDLFPLLFIYGYNEKRSTSPEF